MFDDGRSAGKYAMRPTGGRPALRVVAAAARRPRPRARFLDGLKHSWQFWPHLLAASLLVLYVFADSLHLAALLTPDTGNGHNRLGLPIRVVDGHTIEIGSLALR